MARIYKKMHFLHYSSDPAPPENRELALLFTEYYQNVEKFFPKLNLAQAILPDRPRPGVRLQRKTLFRSNLQSAKAWQPPRELSHFGRAIAIVESDFDLACDFIGGSLSGPRESAARPNFQAFCCS